MTTINRLIDSVRDIIYELKDEQNGYPKEVQDHAKSLNTNFEAILTIQSEELTKQNNLDGS